MISPVDKITFLVRFSLTGIVISCTLHVVKEKYICLTTKGEIMKVLNKSYIRQKIKDSGMIIAELAELSKDVDPTGKGVAQMTFSRAQNEKAGEIYVRSLLIVCATLGISPLSRNLWIDVESE